MRAEAYFVLSQFRRLNRQTDRETDRRTDGLILAKLELFRTLNYTVCTSHVHSYVELCRWWSLGWAGAAASVAG